MSINLPEILIKLKEIIIKFKEKEKESCITNKKYKEKASTNSNNNKTHDIQKSTLVTIYKIERGQHRINNLPKTNERKATPGFRIKKGRKKAEERSKLKVNLKEVNIEKLLG